MAARTNSILVVEPDVDLGELLSYVLGRLEGYSVAVASSMDEATSFLACNRVDLIITEAFDQDDPFAFSPGFLAELRKRAATTPIFLCSAYAFEPGARRAGLVAVLGKPFDMEALVHSVDALLHGPRLSRISA